MELIKYKGFVLLKDNNWYILMTSDFHLFHKNILIYEYEKRKDFIVKENNEINIEKSFIKFYNFLLDSLSEIINQYKITKFINCGDYIFNANKKKIELYTKLLNYKKFYNLLENVEKIFILWNHDVDYKWRSKEELILFLKNLWYNEVVYYYEYKNYIFTHMPIWQSLLKDLNIAFSIRGEFINIDKELINKLKNNKYRIINFHWHLHSKDVDKKILKNNIKNVKDWINISFDYNKN